MDFKRYLDSINKYLSLILFVPLLVGGLSQFINLYLISPNFVRFFSPTQAISDGILCLIHMCLSIVFLMLYSVIGLSDKIERAKMSTDTDKEKYRTEVEAKQNLKSRFIYLILLILVCYALYFFITVVIPHNNNGLNDDAIKLIFLGLMIMILFFGILISFIGLLSNYKYFFRRRENDKIIISLLIISNLAAFILVSVYTNNQNKSINFKFLKEKYECPNNKKIEIKYYNDKYIFLERKCFKDSTEIIIDKFESIFDISLVK
ncbi:hypothetical protein KIH23_13490 [Flavobacterium sp. CYK-55]|uniref:hypothetical protein n=1 Tax=Flavobacterium sp. CYK-55 TaxID=2835529 RepID=UPI001BCF46EE|nr:hypothetical protein [Flavobacterium sp. CYK-55]MBS7788316.1 hypothetical protein [Flavobacterium sp. CYK-55]